MWAVFVNTIAIIIGTTIGLIVKKGISKELSDVIVKALGLCVIIIGIQGAIQETNALIMIISIIFGITIGELIKLDSHVNSGIDILATKFSKKHDHETNKENNDTTSSNLAEVIVSSSLIMSVGAMAIVGSLDAGLSADYALLYTKSLLDFITGIMLGASMGIGVYGSAVFTFVSQGIIVLLSGIVAPYLSDALILELSCTGSVMIVAIGLNMVNLTKFKVLNFVPAFLIVPFAYKLIKLML